VSDQQMDLTQAFVMHGAQNDIVRQAEDVAATPDLFGQLRRWLHHAVDATPDDTLVALWRAMHPVLESTRDSEQGEGASA
jgi:hypothetical protein